MTNASQDLRDRRERIATAALQGMLEYPCPRPSDISIKAPASAVLSASQHLLVGIALGFADALIAAVDGAEP